MRFGGKTIVVTGGAMGIGAATVQRLAKEGAMVILVDRDEERGQAKAAEIKQGGGKALFFLVDLAEPDSVAQLGTDLADRFRCLHGLVNNAGIVRRSSIAETGEQDWEPQIHINLRAPALCAQALLPLLKEGPGHIVNISSEGGFRPRSDHWVYDASKAGICALTRNMACEFIQYGMRVNSVAPGWVVTEMHFGGAEDPMARKAELERIASAGGLIPRLARPAEIAAAIAFLLSDDASYITATTLHVDGGRVAH